MRSLAIIISACFLASNTISADDLKIASWNLNGFKPIKSRQLNNIISGMKMLDADMYVLSEVNPVSHTKKIAKALSKDGACYKYKAPKQDTATHHIGFVYKCAIETSGSGKINGSDLSQRGYREAIYMNAKAGNFDFMLVGAHLKAGKGEEAQTERSRQLDFVANRSEKAASSGEKDIIVTGTLNIKGNADPEAAEFKALNRSGHFKSAINGQSGNYINKNGSIGSLTSGIAHTASEYKDGSASVVQLHDLMDMPLADFRENVSDRLPVVALFDTSADKD